MRRLFRAISGPLLPLSLISAFAVGSYILLKFGYEFVRNAIPLKSPGTDHGDTVAQEAGGGCPDTASAGQEAGIDNGVSEPPQPMSGTVFVRPEAACIAPLTVEVQGAGNYYIYLEYLRAPDDAEYAEKAASGPALRSDIGFFAAGNSTATVNVPVGIFSLSYAAGEKWRGLSEKFGPGMRYYRAGETLTFYTDGKYAHGNTIRLFPRYDEDASFDQIAADAFPG